MTHQFRPRFDLLEARDVPAAFSAVLPSGAVVSGSFSTPDGVDPAQSSQSLAIADLAVTKGGVAYTTQPGASAQYAYGALVGVSGYASAGPDVISLSGTTVENGSDSAPLALDGADTQMTFTLPDGNVGALSYNIPWDQVDAAQASQSIPLDAMTPGSLNLNIAGRNFVFPNGPYTTAPTLQFAYGEFVGLSFTLDASGVVGSPYSSITAGYDANGSNIITAIQAGTGQPLQALAAAANNELVMDFSSVTTGKAYTVTIKLLKNDGTVLEELNITVSADATAADIAQSVVSSLEGNATFTATRDGTKVDIRAKAAANWTKVEYTTYKLPAGQQDNTINGPKFILDQGGVKLWVNGTKKNPN